MESGDKLSASGEHVDLMRDASRSAPVVIIPVADGVAESTTTTVIPLFSNAATLGQMNKADALIVWQQVPNVLPVRDYQQLRVPVDLRLEARDRLR